jgi:DNA-binding transcriptional LysR family regulator
LHYRKGAAVRIEQLEYIEAVTRLGSLRRAAEELHLSQPALSETVRNLERELGVALFERSRSGAKVSDQGRELLPHIIDVLDAVDRLRRAADEQHHTTRTVRIGTVNAATVSLLLPVIAEFREAHPSTKVEVVGAQQTDIHRGLVEGGFDLGLVNFLRDDDGPPDLRSTELLRGRAVVCLRPDSPLAELESVTVAELETVPLIEMRAGYVMHRLLHRFLQERTASIAYATEGAEMGKLMVAEGLGATVLPEYSVAGDPLERTGAITFRPLDPPGATVRLMIQRRRTGTVPSAVRDLHELFVERARARVGERLGDPG